ncbi:MAG: hypothetical protein E7600_02070 [Ruminococcaceae bacterium]|nr:hypothetical protein [Oscillospiraceae bacterium]
MNQDNNENIQNESMVLYRGIYEAIKEYPPRSKADALYAILDYGFYGIIPQSKNYNVISAFNFSKPVIDKAKKRYKRRVENGRKGGAPKGNTNALKKITYSQETTENNRKTTENNLNDNVNVNDNDNNNENVYDNIQKEPDKAGSNTLPVGEYKNVFLSATEKAKLIVELGYDGYEKSVDCLSRYIKRKPGFSSACHFEDLRGWVQDHMRKNGVYHTAEAEEKHRKAIEAGFDFEFEDIFEKP